MGKDTVSPSDNIVEVLLPEALDEIPPWPKTPEEREAITGYGDLVSTIIWYPEYVIRCRNCSGEFKDHDNFTGACNPDDLV